MKLACALIRGALIVTLVAAISAHFDVRAGRAADVRTESFKLLNQGVTAYKNGEYAEAVKKLERAANMALNNFRVHFYLGLAQIGDRRYDEALKSLTIALDLDPSHLQSLIAMGDAFLKIGDINESEAGYYRALKLRPEYAPALDGLARVQEAQAKDSEAIATFRRAISADRGYAPAYTHLGDFYLRRGRIEEAVMLLEEAVQVRPDYTPGLNRLAMAYGRLRLDNEAVATIQKAIQLDSRNATHPATLGELQLAQGFVPAAEASFRAALELDSSLPEARLGLARVARRRGEYAAALEQLDIALNDPRTSARSAARLEHFRGTIESEEVEVRRLEALIAEAAKITPEDLDTLSMIHARRAMWESAAELVAEAGLDPEREDRRAYMLFQAGHFGEAHEIYSRLAEDRDDAELELNSGVALALLGNDEGAVAAYGRALTLEPGRLEARLYLGNSLLRLGRELPAVAAYTQFLDEASGGESAERVRRILRQIAPDSLPPPPDATQPGAPRTKPGDDDESEKGEPS